MKSQDQIRTREQIDQQTPAEISAGVLQIVIPYTTPELTTVALRHAGVCSDLDVHVSLIDVQVVPFPCPIDQPPIRNDYSQRRLEELFTGSGLRGQAAVLYTRDWLEGYRRVLQPDSLVVIAAKNRWWPTRETKLARALSRAGHQVMLLPVR